MKILQVHVYYTTSLTSGENSTVETINSIFSEYAIADTLIFKVPQGKHKFFQKLKLVFEIFKNFLKLFFDHTKYDIIFFHNQIPFIPAFMLSYFSHRTTVVKVWHNLRPFCIKGSAFRQGANCTKCTEKKFGQLNAIRFRCYRGNLWQTIIALVSQLGIVSTLKSTRVINVTVSSYISDLLNNSGFHPTRIFCVENSLSNLDIRRTQGNDFIYMGRITEEKGVDKLLLAWDIYTKTYGGDQKLHILGDGPLLPKLRVEYEDSNTIFYGHCSLSEINEISKKCKIGIIPNVWQEPFGKVALDYLSLGLQILSTKSGGITEILMNDSGTKFIELTDSKMFAEQMHVFYHENRKIDYISRMDLLNQYSRSNTKKKWISLLDKIG